MREIDGSVLEELGCFLHCHVQHFSDVFALVKDAEGFFVVAFAFAFAALHVNVGQKVHFYSQDAVALASFASATLHVEAEPAFFVAACFSFFG